MQMGVSNAGSHVSVNVCVKSQKHTWVTELLTCVVGGGHGRVHEPLRGQAGRRHGHHGGGEGLGGLGAADPLGALGREGGVVRRNLRRPSLCKARSPEKREVSAVGCAISCRSDDVKALKVMLMGRSQRFMPRGIFLQQ